MEAFFTLDRTRHAFHHGQYWFNLTKLIDAEDPGYSNEITRVEFAVQKNGWSPDQLTFVKEGENIEDGEGTWFIDETHQLIFEPIDVKSPAFTFAKYLIVRVHYKHMHELMAPLNEKRTIDIRLEIQPPDIRGRTLLKECPECHAESEFFEWGTSPYSETMLNGRGSGFSTFYVGCGVCSETILDNISAHEIAEILTDIDSREIANHHTLF